MYRLFLSRAAEEDFENIVSYMTKELANPIAAEHFLDAVNDCYTNLKNMPKMYEESRDPYLRSSGYRKAVIGKYITQGLLRRADGFVALTNAGMKLGNEVFAAFLH